MGGRSRNKVFISYSHQDDPRWLDDFTRMLAPAVHEENLDVWSDRRIEPGAPWKAEIEEALAKAQAALLLVSPSYLGSPFIQENEFLPIVKAARQSGLSLHWVLVAPAMYEMTYLRNIQASWPVDQPLIGLSEPDRYQAIHEICAGICLRLDQGARVNVTERDRLRNEAQRHLPHVQLGEFMAGGRISVVYSATRDGELPAAVKVFADSAIHEQASEDVLRQARLAERLKHPAFIKLLEVQLAQRPYSIITEFVRDDTAPEEAAAPTLARLIDCGAGCPKSRRGPFEVDRVVTILRKLCEALAEAADAGLVYGTMSPSNVMMQDPVTPRISAFGFWTFLSRNQDLAANFVVDREALSYMCPEHFYGREITSKTDQYALGLLALEMLEGKRPVTIRCPADFIAKERFFLQPLDDSLEWPKRHPAVADILRRMLEVDAEKRWPSLGDVARRLGGLECEAVVEAKKSYAECCDGHPEFWKAFYDRFFELCPEARALFGHMDASLLERHYRMLDAAVQSLLNFSGAPAVEPTVLSAVRRRHSALPLEPGHYDLFATALLDVLRDTAHQPEHVLGAWRFTITPGLQYMKNQDARLTGSPRSHAGVPAVPTVAA